VSLWLYINYFSKFKTYIYQMAGRGTPLSKALTLWEEKNPGKSAAEAEEIKLVFLVALHLLRIRPSTSYRQVC